VTKYHGPNDVPEWVKLDNKRFPYGQGNSVFERIRNGDRTDYQLNFTTLPQVLRVNVSTYEK
jgi:hypothetical protein